MVPPIPNHFRERFVHFFLNQAQRSKSEAVKAFKSPIFSRRTLYRILSDFEKTGSVKLKPRTSRKGYEKSGRNAHRVRARFETNPDKTIRRAVAELGMNRSKVAKLNSRTMVLKREQKNQPRSTRKSRPRVRRKTVGKLIGTGCFQ